MATIDTSIEINASIDKVWDIISDLDAEPKFWKGTKETRIISRDGNGGSLLEANWDIKMGGLAGMFTGMIKKHIRSGTEQAIESIKKQAESS